MIAWTGVYSSYRQWQQSPRAHTSRPTSCRPPPSRCRPPLRGTRPGRRRGSARQQQPFLHVCALSQVGARAARDAPRAARQPVPQRPGHVQPDAAPLRRRADGRRGYTARLIALALLVAVQEKRVLILVPHASARWCAREPDTLGCYYEPITHCTYRPDWQNISFKWSTRGSSFGLRGGVQYRLHLRISTSQVHRSIFWYKFHPPQTLFAGTHELLFKPSMGARRGHA